MVKGMVVPTSTKFKQETQVIPSSSVVLCSIQLTTL